MPAIKSQAALDKFALRIYGCSHDDAVRMNDGLDLRERGTKSMLYVTQRGNAKYRGIPWLFTFDSWLLVWEASGHWEDRGVKRGQYVMSRFGDVGPYSPENVEIKTASENCSEAIRRTNERKRISGRSHACI